MRHAFDDKLDDYADKVISEQKQSRKVEKLLIAGKRKEVHAAHMAHVALIMELTEWFSRGAGR